jgi:membrane protein required for colicin V production
MSIFDLVILGLLALFVTMGVLRGMVRELYSLGVWLIAILCGWLFADAIGSWFEVIEDAELRRLAAFLAVIMVMLALLTLAMFILRILLPSPSPDATSRVIGGALGGMRGAAVIVVLVLLAGLTGLPKKDGWRDSYLVAVFQPAAEQILQILPASVARQFRYG